MKKTIRIPLIALSVVTTQLAVLLGNTAISKSAQYKQISQSYYNQQIPTQSLPVTYEQEKQTELIAQSFSDQYNRQEQLRETNSKKCDQMIQQVKQKGYGDPSNYGVHFVGASKGKYVVIAIDVMCRQRIDGYLNEPTDIYRHFGESGSCDYTLPRSTGKSIQLLMEQWNGMSLSELQKFNCRLDHFKEWKLEGDKLCRYELDKYPKFKGSEVSKRCFNRLGGDWRGL